MELSYNLNNSNNIKIDLNEEYYVIPFGHRCTSALCCKYASLRKFSLPFDQTIPLYPNKIKSVLKNNFKNFIPDVDKNIFINEYNIKLAHFNKDLVKGRHEYIRRIERFNKIINENRKIYFVYINEDYLYSTNYRDKDFNNKLFLEMLELEHFLNKKYPNIKFIILYFNFFNHCIPKDSKIINIVLKTNKIYNSNREAPYENFRCFCGKILSNIFKTKYISGYDNNIFNN